MSAAILKQNDATASSGGVAQKASGPPRRKRKTAVKRIVLSAFALAWIVGCLFVLSHVFSAVRLKCAGCPECLGTAP
jgi:hypothetical protein